MSQVAPQVDVGSLTLSGLASFAPILAVLSADDVDSLAMIQMQNLGSLFHTNGKYACQVPDLLRRCKSTRVDRIGLLVGWRKGDAASLMAASAGGQAIALLSMCIVNLYKPADIGRLLIDLSKNMVPRTIAISSPSQLIKVAETLSSKLETIGFGNVLAEQVTRVHDAYEHLGKLVPNNFLDDIPPENMAELFHALTRAVREESIVVRITGSRAKGHILAIVMIMFPEDTFVTLENVIVVEGLRKSILVQFTGSDEMIKIQVESEVQIQSTEPILPIEIHPRTFVDRRRIYRFKWNGWIADMLQLMFTEHRLLCPELLRIACCDMLVPLLTALRGAKSLSRTDSQVGKNGVMNLLGPYPHGRIDQVCQKLWRIPSGWAKPGLSLTNAYGNLRSAFFQATTTVNCSCPLDNRCLGAISWRLDVHRSIMKLPCKKYCLWIAIGEALGYGFSCLFVNAGDNATIEHHLVSFNSSSMAQDISILIEQGKNIRNSCENIHNGVMRLFGSVGSIASSSNSSTVYMAALQDLQLPNTMNGLFDLVEGQLIFNGRYHTEIIAVPSSARPPAKEHTDKGTRPIIPSTIGEHTNIMVTLLEGIKVLELTATIHIGGGIVHLDLVESIVASWGLDETEPCVHLMKTPLESQYENTVLTTSVASPCAIMGKIAIVQVSQNPVAQLLSCVRGTHALLQKECCLNCAYKQAKGKYGMIIVT